MSQWPISKYAKQVSCSISELQIPDSVVKCLPAFIKNALQYSHAAPNETKCANISIILIDAHLSPPTMFSVASILLMLNIHTLPSRFLPFVTDLHLVVNIASRLLVCSFYEKQAVTDPPAGEALQGTQLPDAQTGFLWGVGQCCCSQQALATREPLEATASCYSSR